MSENLSLLGNMRYNIQPACYSHINVKREERKVKHFAPFAPSWLPLRLKKVIGRIPHFKLTTVLIACLLITSLSLAQQPHQSPAKAQPITAQIKWHTFEEALQLQQQPAPKKIFIDMYTDWCGWCKKMDATTFKNDTLIQYLSSHFYAVKFDAERKDTIMIGGNMYINPNPKGTRSTHQLAAALMQNRLSYPSSVFLDEKGQLLSVVPGYMNARDMEKVLHFFGENAYMNQKWEDFLAGFKGNIK